MSIPLPPLPPTRSGWVADDHHMTWYDVDQLRARDLEVARVVLEAAAKVCGDYATKATFDGDPESDHEGAATYLQDRIRALEFHHAE